MKTAIFATLARTTLATLLLASTLTPASATMIPNPLGSKSDSAFAAREIRIGATTRAINVSRFEIVRIVNAAGEKFTWQFDTLHHPVIELSKIAPAGFSPQSVLVYVGQGADERS